MPEYTGNALQTVAAGENVQFTASPVVCNRGFVCHRDGSGIVTLKGPANHCRARYKVSFGGNIAVSAGGTVGPVSVALAISGDPLASTTAIVTPAALSEFFNVFTAVFLDVPRGESMNVTVRNTSGTVIDVQNANLIIERVA